MGNIYRELSIGQSELYKVNPKSIIIQEGFNPREDFNVEKLEELKDSIIENGVLVPLRVKINAEKQFILIDGERRLRAVLQAINEGHQIVSVPVIIERKTMTELEQLLLALNTNTGEQLSAIEEANAYKRLMNYGLEIKDISKKLGRAESRIKTRLLLIDSSKEVKEALNNKDISVHDAITIIKDSFDETDQKEKLEIVKAEKAERKEQSEKKKIAKKSGKLVYDKKDFVELTGDMIEWLIELNNNNPDGKIKQVEELIIKAQKMLDSEDL